MPYDAPGPEAENRIREASPHLGPRALQLLADIAERLAKGAKQYGGDFDDKPRDWVQETLEETADGLVYASMELLKVREAKAADEARNRAARRLSDDTQAQLQAQQLAGYAGGVRETRVHPTSGTVTHVYPVAGSREPLSFTQPYGPPTERDGVWAECSRKPTWPLNTPGEDWEKTRAGCG